MEKDALRIVSFSSFVFNCITVEWSTSGLSNSLKFIAAARGNYLSAVGTTTHSEILVCYCLSKDSSFFVMRFPWKLVTPVSGTNKQDLFE